MPFLANIFARLINYYRLEWGQAGPPEDPNAPPGRIDGWPRPAATTPPMPYTEWPMGAVTPMGVTRPNSVDSPFMAAIVNTSVGRWMYDNHIQFYGWVNDGFNLSTNSTQPGGNGPIGYTYTPNVAHFDPDIEAQLAPNNITHTHSLTYTWDNYTNNGIVASLQIDPNLMVQLGLSDGTETPIWNCCRSLTNLFGPNPLYNGPNYRRDPGNQPSATACVRYSWNDGWDNFYPCMNGFNNGAWGYNNLQWSGFTYYHRFNDQWHIAFESYYEFENGVPNLRNPTAVNIFNNGGTPFLRRTCTSTRRTWYIAQRRRAHMQPVFDRHGPLINYTTDPLNKFTLRPEWYDDPYGWRTGTGGRTQYYETALSWQHWLSPADRIPARDLLLAVIGTPAFNGNSVKGIPANKRDTGLFAADVISISDRPDAVGGTHFGLSVDLVVHVR